MNGNGENSINHRLARRPPKSAVPTKRPESEGLLLANCTVKNVRQTGSRSTEPETTTVICQMYEHIITLAEPRNPRHSADNVPRRMNDWTLQKMDRGFLAAAALGCCGPVSVVRAFVQ